MKKHKNRTVLFNETIKLSFIIDDKNIKTKNKRESRRSTLLSWALPDFNDTVKTEITERRKNREKIKLWKILTSIRLLSKKTGTKNTRQNNKGSFFMLFDRCLNIV